jgi:acyl-CoA reductase-like NAD-dependent aldehyde dehydrogenase
METASAETSENSAKTEAAEQTEQAGAAPPPAEAQAETTASEEPAKPAGPSPFPEGSPVDGAPLAAVEATDAARIPEMIQKARAAQVAWAATSVPNRAAVLFKLKSRILARAQEIAELLHREVGKPVEEAALSEVLPNADLVEYWATSMEELLDDATVELDALAYPGKLGKIVRDPRGVVALITPWNYPVSIPLRSLVPALLAGNAVLFKPSEVSARSGALVASLFEGLLPDGVLQIVQGAGDVGQALIADGVDLVVFTGSVATGKRIAAACAELLIPCSLELGGKDAAIVLKDCNVERTARGLVWGAFTNAGQNCASIERVYVDKAVADKLVPRVVALTKELRPGVDTGVLTTKKQCDVVRRHLEEATSAGAEVLAGGLPAEGNLDFPPTVVKVTDENTPLMKDETFGPILPIVVVDDEEDAVRRANASRYGLTTSIWTKRINHAHDLARRLKSGVVTINNHGFTGALPAAPWTGVGESGNGITNSPHALAELTRVRFVLEDRTSQKSELWWYPYTPVLRTLVFAMARARGGTGFFGRIAAFFQLLGALPKRLLGG